MAQDKRLLSSFLIFHPASKRSKTQTHLKPVCFRYLSGLLMLIARPPWTRSFIRVLNYSVQRQCELFKKLLCTLAFSINVLLQLILNTIYQSKVGRTDVAHLVGCLQKEQNLSIIYSNYFMVLKKSLCESLPLPQ